MAVDVRKLCKRIRDGAVGKPMALPIISWNGLKLPFIVGKHKDRAIVLHHCECCHRYIHWTTIQNPSSAKLTKITCSNCGYEKASLPVFDRDIPTELTTEELIALMDRLCWV